MHSWMIIPVILDRYYGVCILARRAAEFKNVIDLTGLKPLTQTFEVSQTSEVSAARQLRLPKPSRSTPACLSFVLFKGHHEVAEQLAPSHGGSGGGQVFGSLDQHLP